jgi:type III pantothenate kinase
MRSYGLMLLAIDVGNTQTHIAVFDGEALVEHWRFATDGDATADLLAVRLSNLLELRGLELAAIDAAIVSSVVPPLNPEYARMAERYLDGRFLSVLPGVKTGIAIRMDNPLELGADRLVNAVAAYNRFGGACAVVDFGTAITFDAISAQGEYLGGVIGPGVRVSMEALTERAAKLPKVDLAEPASVIGKTTQASMQSGMVYGFAGAIDAIARRLIVELGEETSFIATGGGAEVIVPFCETIDEVDDLLTLTGLRLIHELNG